MAIPPRFLPLLLTVLIASAATAQDVLTEMPRYDRYDKLRREISGSIRPGTASVTWSKDGKSLSFSHNGKSQQLDLVSGKISEGDVAAAEGGRRQGARRAPERGRQFDMAMSPDEKHKAFHRNGNVFLSDADGKNEIQVTTDGSPEKRIKYGIASWVYGEELGVREAMWWSPDGSKLAYYRFDESAVKDYYLQLDQSKIQDTLDVEAYPKAGAPNPVVGLQVYDVAAKKSVSIDTRFEDASLGEYVYDIRWAPDGRRLLFNRTNRKQNVMELCIADLASGTSRTVARESQPQSWAENHPRIEFLSDGRRFIWSSERNGFNNLYLYDLDGKQLVTLTDHQADVDRIVDVNEAQGRLYYMARTGNNPYLMQLHSVGLDGKKDVRHTDPAYHHVVSLSPDGQYFSDVWQNATTPPTTTVRKLNGTPVAELAKSDTTQFETMGLKRVERFTYTAADGKTVLYGSLHFPSDFDPSKSYPLLVSVYGGPESGGSPETFQTPNAITEMGFLLASFEGRGTNGRGKAFRDAVYGKLGIVEIDDQAAGVKALAERPYVNGKRVGIFGTSYGGYASLMALLRHPDVFHVAVASSSVTDWRHYDSIYTERFQGLPTAEDNLKGYEAGSAMTYVRDLKGKLMLYYGTADNNVHPSNTLQLVRALEDAGKRYDMQVGPDRGHTGVNQTRMWEYFVTHLIIRPRRENVLARQMRRRSQAQLRKDEGLTELVSETFPGSFPLPQGWPELHRPVGPTE